jgi:hypothetical protein
MLAKRFSRLTGRMTEASGGFQLNQTHEPIPMRYLTKSTLLALALLVGIELGNTYSIQLANNLPSAEVFDRYFGVLSPLAMRFYLLHHQHVKVESIS